MSRLLATCELLEQIEKINCSNELKKLINKFIELKRPKKHEKFTGISFRCNLHFIIDNIKREQFLKDEILRVCPELLTNSCK